MPTGKSDKLLGLKDNRDNQACEAAEILGQRDVTIPAPPYATASLLVPVPSFLVQYFKSLTARFLD